MSVYLDELDSSQQDGTALIHTDDSVWVVLCPQFWDLATWLWWWLAPLNGKAWVHLKTSDGCKIRARAVRVARSHVRIGS